MTSAYEPTLFEGLPPAAQPVTPYPDGPGRNSSGWSGSDTSHERAVIADSNGTTTERQQAVLRALRMREAEGLTWKELATLMEWHHGQASGALSVLHKDGQVARLAEVRRHRCAVYVLPRYVHDRPTAAQGRQPGRVRVTLDTVADVLTDHEPAYLPEAGGEVGCSCGWQPDHDLDYTHHLLQVLAQGPKA